MSHPLPYAHTVKSLAPPDPLFGTGAVLHEGDLDVALRLAWSASTSAAPSWTPDIPSAGQCAVTALLVQDLLGGVLLRGVVCGETHYWNRLPGGSEVDFTAAQFAEYRLDVAPEVRERSYVLGFPDTIRRYHTLRAAVLKSLPVDFGTALPAIPR